LSHFDMQSGQVEQVITRVLGLALLPTAVVLVFRTRLIVSLGVRGEQATGRWTALLTVVTGMALGVLVSLTSVGAGALGVPALVLLYPALPMERIVGSDIVHAVPLTLVGGISHWVAGSVNAPILVSLLIGSLPGIVAGSYATSYVSERAIRLALAAILVIVGGKLVL